MFFLAFQGDPKSGPFEPGSGQSTQKLEGVTQIHAAAVNGDKAWLARLLVGKSTIFPIIHNQCCLKFVVYAANTMDLEQTGPLGAMGFIVFAFHDKSTVKPV